MNPPLREVSIVIPVYGSRQTLRPLLDRLLEVFRGEGLDYEIIFVDDASPDGAWEVLREIREAAPERISAIQLMRNFGQHNALMCGLQQARGRYVITMDDDLQHPPEEIPGLLRRIETSGDDVVYGVPAKRQHRHWRNLGSALLTRFYRRVFSLSVTPSAFRAMRREAVQAILSYGLNYTYIDGLLAWNTRRISEVPVPHAARSAGRSGYSPGKLLVLALNLLTNFSLLPLQIVSLFGFLASGFGFLMGGYYLLQHLLGRIEVPGYASIIVSIFVLGGLQLLALGIIGEYLGRMHLNVNRKPQYTVRTVLSGRTGSGEPEGSERRLRRGEEDQQVASAGRGGRVTEEASR